MEVSWAPTRDAAPGRAAGWGSCRARAFERGRAQAAALGRVPTCAARARPRLPLRPASAARTCREEWAPPAARPRVRSARRAAGASRAAAAASPPGPGQAARRQGAAGSRGELSPETAPAHESRRLRRGRAGRLLDVRLGVSPGVCLGLELQVGVTEWTAAAVAQLAHDLGQQELAAPDAGLDGHGAFRASAGRSSDCARATSLSTSACAAFALG